MEKLYKTELGSGITTVAIIALLSTMALRFVSVPEHKPTNLLTVGCNTCHAAPAPGQVMGGM